MFTFRNSSDATSALPLLIGLIGPSGGGKTLSALRLATGIQKIRGGKIVALDTEARRMLHYRKQFDFRYLEFTPPFSSLRYCEALQAAAKEAEGGVVIVDSMSHEHESTDGYLEYHEKELQRIAGDDWKARQKNTFSAWIKPAGDRRKLINTLLQIDCAFIFCFRAKEKLKIIPGQQPINLGWQAIAGEEFAYEMTVRCLLGPGANGVPDWSEDAFKHHVAKLGDSHKAMFPLGKQLDESIGERLAIWAKGDGASQQNMSLEPVKPSIDWKSWADKFSANLFKITTLQQLESIKSKNSQKLLTLATESPSDFKDVEAVIAKIAKNLTPIENTAA